jgi:hypothetical protein
MSGIKTLFARKPATIASLATWDAPRPDAMSDDELVDWFAGLTPASRAPQYRSEMPPALRRLVALGILPPVKQTDLFADVWRAARDACIEHAAKRDGEAA